MGRKLNSSIGPDDITSKMQKLGLLHAMHSRVVTKIQIIVEFK